VIGREREIAVVSALLDSEPRGPRALLVDGEAGIGKSTVWFEAVRLAEVRGYRVLRARPAESEAKLSYATLEVNGNTHTAGPLLARDFQLIDVTGTANTRADFLAAIGGGVDFVTLKPIEPISVRVHGDSAVARVKLKFKVVAGGATVQHEGWTTDLFEQRDARWQVVWSQTTAVPNNLDLFIQSLQP
jgi:hypothetical protein